MNNYMSLKFKSLSENEALARAALAAFVAPMNPNIEELADIKTSVSEAVTNSIIHGYEKKTGIVELIAYSRGNELTVRVIDHGTGIHNITRAMEPLYTSKPELERSGMGFTIMESFMDSIEVISSEKTGTTVVMRKRLRSASLSEAEAAEATE